MERDTDARIHAECQGPRMHVKLEHQRSSSEPVEQTVFTRSRLLHLLRGYAKTRMIATAAAVEAALVDTADRGGRNPHLCATRCDKLPAARAWTEMSISVPKRVACGRLLAAPA